MKTILVIDDNEMFRLMFADWLSAQGFHPVTAEDGLEGLRLAQTYNPALIFCDVNMPFFSGLEVLRLLRLSQSTSQIPFFFLTSESNLKPDKIQQMGANGIIMKSNSIEELHHLLGTFI